MPRPLPFTETCVLTVCPVNSRVLGCAPPSNLSGCQQEVLLSQLRVRDHVRVIVADRTHQRRLPHQEHDVRRSWPLLRTAVRNQPGFCFSWLEIYHLQYIGILRVVHSARAAKRSMRAPSFPLLTSRQANDERRGSVLVPRGAHRAGSEAAGGNAAPLGCLHGCCHGPIEGGGGRMG